MHYDLFSLTLFLGVAETGSIAGAATRHNIAASAVSRRMSELEASIGTALLYRQQRGVELTPAGLELRRHAQIVLRQVGRMDRSMEDFADGMRGAVRIAANTSSITQFLPEDLAAFSRDYPNIRIKLVEMFSTEVIATVRSGEADLGICSGLTETGDLDTVLYRRDTLVLAVPDGHRFATLESISLDEILEENIVSLQDGSSIQAFVDAQAATLGRHMRTRVEVMSFDGVRRMVEAGLGVAILPHGAVADAAGGQNLSMVAIDEPWAQRELLIVMKAGTELGRTTRAMLACLTGQMEH